MKPPSLASEKSGEIIPNAQTQGSMAQGKPQTHLDPQRERGLYWGEMVGYDLVRSHVVTPGTGPMDHGKPTTEPLDATWLIQLRQRFSEIAARRVPESAVDDVVQDALSIVLVKGGTQPPLPWSFTVLRNVIGNYYQKRRGHQSLDGVEVQDDRPDALAALTTDERHRTIRTAVDELRQERPDCAGWLWSLAQGIKAGQLADRAQLDRDAFYRKIYRCRQQLAAILRRKGVTA